MNYIILVFFIAALIAEIIEWFSNGIIFNIENLVIIGALLIIIIIDIFVLALSTKQPSEVTEPKKNNLTQ